MVAIVRIGGQQWRTEESQVLRVPKIDASPGETVDLDVLCLIDDQRVEFGRPIVEGVKARALILSHGKGDKILIFKKKRRKNYQLKRGHRQAYSEIRIEGIVSNKGVSQPSGADVSETIGATEMVKPKAAKPRKASPKATSKRTTKQQEE